MNLNKTPDLFKKAREIIQPLNQAHLSKDSFWRLKSISLWIKYGDKHNEDFHKHANARRDKNTINENSLSNVSKTIYFDKTKKATFNHFKELYSELPLIGKKRKRKW